MEDWQVIAKAIGGAGIGTILGWLLGLLMVG